MLADRLAAMVRLFSPTARRWWLILLGPALALLVVWLLPVGDGPGELSRHGRTTLAICAWLAAWWVTEAIALEAAALLPLAVFPLTGVLSMKAAAAPYADEVVFLFLGGMLMGAAMERWNLHTRLALNVMILLGTRPAALIAGLLSATAILSMWVSNTAAALMMLPIATGVVALTHERHEKHGGGSRHDRDARHFAAAAVLAIAYGASIGGVGTIIGSPPNGVFAAFAKDHLITPVSFNQWAMVGMPIMLACIPITWVLLIKLHPFGALRVHGAKQMLTQRLRELGRMTQPQWVVIGVFALACVGWIFREPLAGAIGLIDAAPEGKTNTRLTDAGVAVIAALLLFILPVGRTGDEEKSGPVLNWPTASKVPWGVLLMFGGGLALAAALQAHGVDKYVGAQLGALHGMHPLLVLFIITLATSFLSEIGSNTAVTTVLLPIAAAAAGPIGVDPVALCLVIPLGASLSFMLPSGTPPNALAYATGHLRIGQMARAGVLMNIACAAVIAVAVYLLAGVVK